MRNVTVLSVAHLIARAEGVFFLSIAVVVGAATVSARVDLMPHAEICMNIEYTHALNMWFGSSFCLTHAETAAADALFWLYFHPLFARC